MKFKPTRTDRLSPEERAIVDRFERGVIDAAEAGRLLIESIGRSHAEVPPDDDAPETEEGDAVDQDETSEAAKARALVERIAQDVYEDPA
jgi:hypothetical protein